MGASTVKQVIVIRKDLKMRRGKEIAQGSHASISFLSHRVQSMMEDTGDSHPVEWFSDAEKEWLEGSFAKVCVQVDSEEELLKVYDAAKKARLEVHLITDSGLTEFDGVPTKTCLAIGPDYSEKIDPVTGHLKLY